MTPDQYESAKHRYLNDARYHAFVDAIMAAMDAGLRPSWVREATDFAIERYLLTGTAEQEPRRAE